MKLIINSLPLLVTLLISAIAYGKKTREKESSAKVPIVAVANLKVDSTNENVQKKIAELTDKVRDSVAESTTNCKVINTKQMRSLMRKHQKKMANCYDDCDVELGLLVGADFVISGRLAPTADSVVTTLEIRDTRTRNVVSSKKIEGNNYFALETSLLSAIKRFVKPLNNVVYQAVDDEVIPDKPAVEPEAAAAESTDLFAPSATQNASAPETGTGTGTAAGTDAGTGTAGTVAVKSDYLAPPPQAAPAEPPSALALKWQEHKEEGHFLKEEDLGFKKAEIGLFGVGISVGYPFNVAKAKHLRDLYLPIFHAGVQISARVHHMLEIDLIGEFDYFSGRNASDHRFGSPGLSNCVYPDDLDEQNLRNCDGNVVFDNDYDDPTNNFYRNNSYYAGSYTSIGIRPTVRLVIPLGGMTEAFVGAGIGFNYVKTSGYWVTDAAGQQFLEIGSSETKPVSEHTAYDIDLASLGFYGVLEAAVVFRLLDKRLGIGPYIEYKLPTMWKKGVTADVTIREAEYTIVPGLGTYEQAFDEPSKKDILESPFGHLEMLNLLTIGLTADWRF